MPIVRNYSRYGDITIFHRGLDEFLTAPVIAGCHSISYGDYLLDLRVVDRGSATTIVCFHAAINPEQTTLPIFVGAQITEFSGANVIYVSEPALDYGVNIGWYAGDNQRRVQSDLVRVFSHAIDALDSKHLIFYGSSAGGFAALFYSHRFSGSLAIVANPQTNIVHYHEEQVRHYVDTCWEGVVPPQSTAVFNVAELYSGGFPNHVAYLQNKHDDFHLEHHFTPWQKACASWHGTHWKALIGDWGDGHSAPPQVLLQGTLAYAAEAAGDWDSFLTDPEFS
ncbi:hypothetical protein [Corynebacterium cystitidis]|uniref:Uncharacterized protein n=1 Tax=Corynebacterium cystitidis DSM 20524 TaxID=1121357 RepID=A0A1H9WAN6_9CORY|nr:hypothetical protein [Corynebacterium cystitidis]WJY82951.1 hypothetical protein CCYS_10195 [Corynebacterium cystitidis DSM 20524]SES30970.1 hypothetical protein SAMN05661109_02632 [Corynebacterium cystitidis DSM 20524]SNV68685.1 Uncharacterised protein [Corynebacterium cystitidis]